MPKRLTYEARAEMAQNAVGKQCLKLMAEKQTNLAVAVDVATADEMLRLADQVAAARLPRLSLITGVVDRSCSAWEPCLQHCVLRSARCILTTGPQTCAST